MKKIKYIRLGEVTEFRNGLNFSKDTRGVGCSLIGIPDFKDRSVPDYESLGEINPDGLATPDDYLKQGDILFVRSNGNKALVGRSMFIDRPITAVFSGFCIRARINSGELDPRFCAYFARSSSFRKSITSSTGTSINNLNQGILSDARIPLFCKTDQKRVTEFLTLLDEKIELNNRINAELEGLAKLLYDYWFVQFDFPMTAEQAAAHGDPTLTGKPYKSSGGKMTHNKTLNREIPEGWDGTIVGKVFKIQLGGTPSRKNPDYWNPGEIPWLASGDKGQTFVLSGDEKISKSGLANSAAALLPKGTVILSIVRHLRASILGIDAATNQSVAGIHETDRFKNCFIYPFVLGEIPRLMSVRTGAQQPHINKGEIEKSPFVIPDDETLGKYHEQTSSIFKQIENHQKQNQELVALRDWLLPMLMNGQVTVQS